MSELKCPCGHSAHNHGNNGCMAGWPVKFTCDCTNNHADAILDAQRTAAIAHLKELGADAKRGKRILKRYFDTDFKRILATVQAFQAIGILKAPKK